METYSVVEGVTHTQALIALINKKSNTLIGYIMPTYKFKNDITGEVWEQFMGISASEVWLEENPDCHKMPIAMSIIGGTGDAVKPNGGFTEVMQGIAAANPYSPLADTYGKKDPTSVKLRNTVANVKKKVGNTLE